MTHYEIKRLLAKSSTRSLCIALIVLPLILAIATVSSVRWICDNDQSISGMAAIDKIKMEKEQWSGELTEEQIAEVIAKNREDGGEYQRTQSYSDIRSMVNFSFCPFREYDDDKIDTLSTEDAQKFYTNRFENLNKWFNGEGSIYFNDKEIKYIMDQYGELNIPLRYEYMDGWKILNESAGIVIVFIAIITCLVVSNIFTSEKQYREDLIFYSTCRGRNSGTRAKLNAALIITSILYICVILIYTVSILGIFGTSGADCMIQTAYKWKSMYNITNLQEFVLIVCCGYIGCVFIVMLTMFISALTLSPVFSSIIAFIVILLPSMIEVMPQSDAVSNIIGLLPDQLLRIDEVLLQFNVYCIGNTVVEPIRILMLMYMLFAIMLYPLSYWVFKTKE